MSLAVKIDGLSYYYSNRKALGDIQLTCSESMMMGILGPNGSGKSTLFQILSTLLYPQTGQVTIYGFDLAKRAHRIREILGVVFQAPSLDQKLTVTENLWHQGRLYGLSGRKLRDRIDFLNEQLTIADRASDRVETLSGGLQRRVELAKGLLNAPKLLLLDEPTTGLDPSARNEFWRLISGIRKKEKTTVFFTTHLITEAELSDQLAILDEGKIVASGRPEELKMGIGKEIVTLTTADADKLASKIRNEYTLEVDVLGTNLRVECDNGAKFVTEMLSKYNGQIDSISKTKSNLEDVFFHKTGKKFSSQAS